MNQITQVLERIQKGEPSAAAALLPLVYDELRNLGRRAEPALEWTRTLLRRRALRTRETLDTANTTRQGHGSKAATHRDETRSSCLPALAAFG
jgi:hypothetical protein